MEITIANPFGANQQVSDFTTFVTADGELIKSGAETYVTLRANAAVAKGQVVALVVPTATTPLSVKPMVTGDSDSLFFGVAENAAAAGGAVKVCTGGVCQVGVGAQTVAFGNFVRKPSATAGEPVVNGTAPAATDVIGSLYGVTLGAKNSANLAPAFIRVV